MTQTDNKAKILAFVSTLGPAGEPPRTDQPLFYTAAQESMAAARRRGNYGLDSLDRVEVAMFCEDAFPIAVHDPEIEELTTIDEIAALVDRKLEERARV